MQGTSVVLIRTHYASKSPRPVLPKIRRRCSSSDFLPSPLEAGSPVARSDSAGTSRHGMQDMQPSQRRLPEPATSTEDMAVLLKDSLLPRKASNR